MSALFSASLRVLQQRGVQVLLTLTLYLLTAPYLPTVAHQWLYTISVGIKDLLLWMLPLTVGAFIAHTVCSFQHRAPLFILTLFTFEALSNLASVWYAFACGQVAQEYLPAFSLPTGGQSFSALWQLPLIRPTWWSADKGVALGLLIGGLGAFYESTRLHKAICAGKDIAQWTLTRIFSPLIPLFILGFVARMYQTQLLHHVIAHYSLLLLWLTLFLGIYISLLFLAGSGWSIRRALTAVKNLTPAGSIAFTSGCSLSTMPWTIEGTSKNLENPHLAKAIIPATTNIQQIGDCITNAFLCFLIYKQFYGHSPDIVTWAHFSLFFVLARFYTAAVLGGAIFIMLPIYESYLGFNSEMIAIILAFNVILDPLVTSCNVVANGALCRIFEQLWTTVLKYTSSTQKVDGLP